MSGRLGRIILYTKRIEDVAAFYVKHFGFKALRCEGDHIVELVPSGDGAHILLHPISAGRK